MSKNELMKYLESNYNFTYCNQSKKELENILEKFIAIACSYDEDEIVAEMSYILN